MSIRERLVEVWQSLPEGVRLVAVSKTHPVEALREAYEAGQRIFGESRPQELKMKFEALPSDVEWHMIGHLQTNKIKYIVPFVSLIESVDSVRLCEALQREAVKCNRVLDILLEIHVACEESKTGWAPEELMAYVDSGAFSGFPNLCVRGVMGIASNTDDEAVVRGDFEALKGWFDRLKPLFGEEFDTLSMGMSDDYPLAIECGSTLVRVGSKIFGERDYSK